MVSSGAIIAIVIIVIIIILIIVGLYFYLTRKKKTSCKIDTDCPRGERCISGSCIKSTGCQSNKDCPVGKVCHNGICENAASCQTNNDCTSNSHPYCVGNFCVACDTHQDCNLGADKYFYCSADKDCLKINTINCNADADCPGPGFTVGGVSFNSVCYSKVCAYGKRCQSSLVNECKGSGYMVSPAIHADILNVDYPVYINNPNGTLSPINNDGRFNACNNGFCVVGDP